jgi:predicted permease
LPMKLSPDSFPQESVIRINLPILAFSVALALLTGLLFGLMPALRLSRPDLARALPANMRGLAVSAPAKRRWSALIAAQVALTLLLMATAGTAMRSFLQLMQVPLGYDPHHVLHIGTSLRHRDSQEGDDAIQSRQARATFIEQIRQKIAAVPGVAVAAVGTYVTPPYSWPKQAVDIAGDLHREQPQAHVQLVSPEYFAALRIPLLYGRIWDASENARGDFTAVVNQAFVKRYTAQADPLSRQIRVPDLVPRFPTYAVSPQSTNWRQIVGVVGDARNDGVDQPVQPAIYLPYTSLMPPNVQFDIRTQGDPLTYLHAIRVAIASIAHYQQTPNGVFTLDEAIKRDSQYTRQRLFSILFGVFSAMALALALVGIFSVVAYSVAQRTTEFGVRLALGAPRAHILWVAGRIALVSTSIGVALGLSLDAFVGKLLAHWMHSAFAATALLSAAALLILSALAACVLPATRAITVPPAEALRYE